MDWRWLGLLPAEVTELAAVRRGARLAEVLPRGIFYYDDLIIFIDNAVLIIERQLIESSIQLFWHGIGHHDNAEERPVLSTTARAGHIVSEARNGSRGWQAVFKHVN